MPLLAPLLALSALALPAQPPPLSLGLRVELLGSRLEGDHPVHLAFTLENTGSGALAGHGWALCFSHARPLAALHPGAPLAVEHVNGDLFRLVPGPGFTGLGPGRELKVDLKAEGWTSQATDAPAGVFLVRDGQEALPVPVRMMPLAPKALERSGFTPRFDPAAAWTLNARYAPSLDAQRPLVLPTPLRLEWLPGQGRLPRDLALQAGPGLEAEAAWAEAWLAPLLGRRPGRDLHGALQLRLGAVAGQTSPEAYELVSGSGGVAVTGVGPAGVFYGLQTLRALVGPDLSIPDVRIVDAPRFPYRGLLLDVARSFQPREKVLRLLDLMGRYKLNTFHFHLTDDEGWRLEIAGLPELTAFGSRRGHGPAWLAPAFGSGPAVDTLPGSGHYTRADFIAILRHARARHIKVIPEFEMPGHARAAIKAMAQRDAYRLTDPRDRSCYRSSQMYDDNVMDPGLSTTYAFIAKVVEETVAMYREAGAPLETIHVGGDEVPAGAWEGSPACAALRKDLGLRGTDELWYVFYDRVDRILKGHGLVTSGWEEAALRKTRLAGRPHQIPNPDFLNRGLRAYVWNNVIGWGAEDLAYRLANAGYPVVLCPVSNFYFDLAASPDPREPGYTWGGYLDVEKPFRFIPFDYFRNQKEDGQGRPLEPSALLGKDGLTEYGAAQVLGLQGCLWSENLTEPDRLDYMLLPKLFGLAERAWAPDPEWARDAPRYAQAWSDFAERVGRELRGLDREGWRYRIPTPGLKVEGGLVHANVAFPGFTLRFTTDDSEPTTASPVIQGPVAGPVTVAAFNSLGRRGWSVRGGTPGPQAP